MAFHPETLAHLANILFGLAYLVRGILPLRILSIVASDLASKLKPRIS